MQVYKYLFIICFTLLSQITISQEIEIKESEQSIIVGFGPTFEINSGLTGINGRLYYGVNESFCFGPEISYFPYQSIDKGYEKYVLDLNINAHYIIELSEKNGFYPLSGINYTIEKKRLVEENDEHEKENEFGLNYGAGLHYKFKNLFLFTEFKGIIGHLDDEFITIGLIYNFL